MATTAAAAAAAAGASAAPDLPCPLPDVQAALSPYIRPRAEALHIRQTLTSFLHSRLRTADGHPPPLSRVALLNPSPDLTATSDTGLSGVYEAYLAALRANAAAKQHVEDLQADVQSLQSQLAAARSRRAEDEAAERRDVGAYVQLLRQQQRMRKIEVVHGTLKRLANDEGNPVRAELDERLERALVQPPEPPVQGLATGLSAAGAGSEGPGGRAGEVDVEARILRLKKEVLTARQAMDASKTLLAEAQGRKGLRAPEVSLQARVYALHCARDELIAWIEGELAKVSDAGNGEGEGHNSLDGLSPFPEDPDEDEDSFDEGALDEPWDTHLDRLYGNYLKSRRQLVDTMDRIKTDDSTRSSSPSTSTAQALPALSTPRRSSRSQTGIADPCNSATILPYVPDMLQIARDERALMQHLAHLRRQLIAGSDEKRRVVDRLADESHLVDPNATSARAWAAAANESNAAMDKAVEEHVRGAERELGKARQNLDEITGRMGALGSLKGDL